MRPSFWVSAAGLGLPGNRLPPYDCPYPRERKNGSICIFFLFCLKFFSNMAECMTAEIAIPYKPRPLQRQLHNQMRRFNVINCHRRFGKTTFGLMHAIRDLSLIHI